MDRGLGTDASGSRNPEGDSPIPMAPNRGRRAGWPLGLIGMLALVGLAERYIAHQGKLDFSSRPSLEWALQARHIQREASKAQLACFGTSLMRLGISPLVLSNRLGLRSYNFALSGAQPYAIYTAFRHALEAGAKPQAVVVEFKWSAIGRPATFNEGVIPEVATLSECAEVAYAVRDADFFFRMALVKYLPSYRCRAEIGENVFAAVGGREPIRNYEYYIEVRNTIVNRGAFHTPQSGYNGKVDSSDSILFPPSWSCDPVCEAYIHKFLGLAESRGIPVFWLIPPISPGASSLREQLGAEAAYTRFVKATTAKHPGVSVIDARGAGYPIEVFHDSTHLSRDGTLTLSADVADAIVDRLSRPGPEPGFWVGLRSYRRNNGTEEIEDVAGSLAIMNQKRMESLRR
jgi:hypothetical protein